VPRDNSTRDARPAAVCISAAELSPDGLVVGADLPSGGGIALITCIPWVAGSGGKFVPLTAVALIVETTRSKTAGPDDARRETAADADDDPFPGMGIDDHTPLGDTSRRSDTGPVATPERGFRAR